MPENVHVHERISYSSDFITSFKTNVNTISKRFLSKYLHIEFGNPEINSNGGSRGGALAPPPPIYLFIEACVETDTNARVLN